MKQPVSVTLSIGCCCLLLALFLFLIAGAVYFVKVLL